MTTPDELLKKAQAGDNEAQYGLFDAYSFGDKGLPKNPAQANYWLKKSAESGHQMAMFTLGVMEITGERIQKNPVSGAHWLEKCAALGDQYAAVTLGLHYLDEETEDTEKALQYLNQAAKANNAEAIYILGTCYLDGLGVPQDEAKARELLTQAAQAGSQDAQDLLNEMDEAN